MQRTEMKIRNFILKINTVVAALAFFFSACCIDSEGAFMSILCMVSLTWLCLFAYANKERIERMVRE